MTGFGSSIGGDRKATCSSMGSSMLGTEGSTIGLGGGVCSTVVIGSLLNVLRGCSSAVIPVSAFLSASNSFSSRCSLVSRLVWEAGVEVSVAADGKGMSLAL